MVDIITHTAAVVPLQACRQALLALTAMDLPEETQGIHLMGVQTQQQGVLGIAHLQYLLLALHTVPEAQETTQASQVTCTLGT